MIDPHSRDNVRKRDDLCPLDRAVSDALDEYLSGKCDREFEENERPTGTSDLCWVCWSNLPVGHPVIPQRKS